ncbi:MAG: hypothetical protein C4529_11070 [Deltaproteobacteria bacterium]|nr:MAG: hypothetical protein C4529_11070 [Deltaproteobacteria bacterium]
MLHFPTPGSKSAAGDGARGSKEKQETLGSERISGLAAWISLFLLVVAAGLFSSRMVEERFRVRKQGIGNAGSGSALLEISRRPALSFGFRNVLADIVWLEAVQIVGNKEISPEQYDRLYDLLDIAANFDPKFEIPYFVGGLVLGESPVHARKALLLLGRGRRQYPAKWRFPFFIGFTHYFSLGDASAGGEAMAEAARLPGSPAYMAGLAARMLSEAREPDSALSMLHSIAGHETDPIRRSLLDRKIREVTVERDLQALERAVARYRETIGVAPARLSDLVREGMIAGVPDEPNGGRYLLGKDGQVRSDRMTHRLGVFRER